MLGGKEGCGFFNPHPLDKSKQGLIDHGIEDPVKMEFGKTGDCRKLLQAELLVQVGFNVIHDPVDSALVVIVFLRVRWLHFVYDLNSFGFQFVAP